MSLALRRAVHGRATAMELARLGAAVVVNDIGTSTAGDGSNIGPAEDVVREIIDAGGRAAANTDSVSEYDAAGRIIDTAIEAFGSVDILVNNAGLSAGTVIWDLDPELFNRVTTMRISSYHTAWTQSGHFFSLELALILSTAWTNNQSSITIKG